MRSLREMDGVPVREVPPDFYKFTPWQAETARPVLAWWARHPDGTLTPVYRGDITPSGVQR